MVFVNENLKKNKDKYIYTHIYIFNLKFIFE